MNDWKRDWGRWMAGLREGGPKVRHPDECGRGPPEGRVNSLPGPDGER